VYKFIKGTVNKYINELTNKSFAGRFAIADKMCCGKSVEIINTLPARTILVPLNFGYEIVLTLTQIPQPL